jgi:hypothetical protein
MLKLTQTQLAYLAGFIDGDGSIYVRLKPNETYRYGFQIAPYIVLFQSAKDETNFQKICAMLDCGYLRRRNDGILEYTIGRKEEILALIQKIKPYLVLKRRQADLLEKIFKYKSLVKNAQDFSKLMDLINQFGDINYSKKRVKHKLTP